MDLIEKELEEKTIERVEEVEPEPEPEPVKKTKKKRTQAQIEAFEKARLARTEKIAARKNVCPYGNNVTMAKRKFNRKFHKPKS